MATTKSPGKVIKVSMQNYPSHTRAKTSEIKPNLSVTNPVIVMNDNVVVNSVDYDSIPKELSPASQNI